MDDAVVVQVAQPSQDLSRVVAHCPHLEGPEVLQQVSHRSAYSQRKGEEKREMERRGGERMRREMGGNE